MAGRSTPRDLSVLRSPSGSPSPRRGTLRDSGSPSPRRGTLRDSPSPSSDSPMSDTSQHLSYRLSLRKYKESHHVADGIWHIAPSSLYQTLTPEVQAFIAPRVEHMFTVISKFEMRKIIRINPFVGKETALLCGEAIPMLAVDTPNQLAYVDWLIRRVRKSRRPLLQQKNLIELLKEHMNFPFSVTDALALSRIHLYMDRKLPTLTHTAPDPESYEAIQNIADRLARHTGSNSFDAIQERPRSSSVEVQPDKFVRFNAAIDLITDSGLWEIKCAAHPINFGEMLQILAYRLLFDSDPDIERYHLYNPVSDEHIECTAPWGEVKDIFAILFDVVVNEKSINGCPKLNWLRANHVTPLESLLEVRKFLSDPYANFLELVNTNVLSATALAKPSAVATIASLSELTQEQLRSRFVDEVQSLFDKALVYVTCYLLTVNAFEARRRHLWDTLLVHRGSVASGYVPKALRTALLESGLITGEELAPITSAQTDFLRGWRELLILKSTLTQEESSE